MNWKIVLRVQGLLLIVLSLTMLFPLFFALYYKGNDVSAFLKSILITLTVGITFSIVFSGQSTINPRESFLTVTLGWISAALFGALPYYFCGSFNGIINSIFESMSGFTTTGATILSEIESLPHGILFWRAMTHWLGGMGIILLTIAILPIIGATSGHLYNAEVPGPTKDRIKPRIQDTAKILWMLYSGMTIIETILLMFGGMSFFNALSHTFSTLATGGFSTLNSSVAGFNSLYIEIIIIVFMYLAGINFTLHYKLLTGSFKSFFKDQEWLFYTLMLLIATIAITFNIFVSTKVSFNQIGSILRAAAFTVVSVTTTTGFCTANFELWPAFSKFIVIFLMFAGGCAGSTAGGMKQIRILVVFKHVLNEIKKLAHPYGVYGVQINEKSVSDRVIQNILAFFILFIFIFAVTTLFLAFMGYDIITCFTASIATLGNIGPGLARVGPIENFGFFDPVSKVVLSFAMLMGRLEIYSVMILIYTLFNRK